MQNGRIFNKNSINANIAFSIFFNQLKHIYLSQENNPFTNEDKPVLTLNEQYVQKILLEFLGQLIHCKDISSAKAIHNFLHLGYLANKNRKYNKLKLATISMLLASPLLDGFEFTGKLSIPQDDCLIQEQTEIEIFAKLIKIFLGHPFFHERFDKSKYNNYRQSKALFQQQYGMSQAVLWNTLIEKSDTGLLELSAYQTNEKAVSSDSSVQHEEIRCVESPKKKGISRLNLLKVGSKRNLKPTNPIKSAPISLSSKKQISSLKTNPEDSVPETFTPAFVQKGGRRSMHLLDKSKQTKEPIWNSFAALSLEDRNTSSPLLIPVVTSISPSRGAYPTLPLWSIHPEAEIEEENTENEAPHSSKEARKTPHKKQPSNNDLPPLSEQYMDKSSISTKSSHLKRGSK